MLVTIAYFIKLNFMSRMEYRGAFLLGIIAQMIFYFSSWLGLLMILNRFNTIGGWIWQEVTMLFAIQLLCYAIGASFSFTQMLAIENEVEYGTFDLLLIKPIDSLLHVAFRGFNTGYLSHLCTSTIVLVIAILNVDVPWTIWKAIYLVACVISGVMIYAAFLYLIGSFAIKHVRSRALFSLFFSFTPFIQYPLSVFPMAIQGILVFIFPLAFVNYFPCCLLLGKDPVFLGYWGSWIAPFVGPTCLLLAYLVWNHSIRGYQGAGG